MRPKKLDEFDLTDHVVHIMDCPEKWGIVYNITTMLFDTMAKRLRDGNRVSIYGFGSFRPRTHVVRSLITGQTRRFQGASFRSGIHLPGRAKTIADREAKRARAKG